MRSKFETFDKPMSRAQSNTDILTDDEEEEEVYLPRHRCVKARGHPPHTLQNTEIAFATSIRLLSKYTNYFLMKLSRHIIYT